MPEYNMDDLEIYRQVVKTSAEENSTEILPNAGKNHAAIAMTELFNQTRDYIRMVVGRFDGNVSDSPEYLRALTRCIEQKIPIDVIHLEDINPASKAYQLLINNKANHRIRIQRASQSFCERLTIDGKPKHFAVFDNDKFRFEKDTEKYIAFFTFNNPIMASKFISLFKLELV